MSSRQGVLDMLGRKPYGKSFDDIADELDLSRLHLEALLANMRRNQLVKACDGLWYLKDQPVIAPTKKPHQPRPSGMESTLAVEVRLQKKQIAGFKSSLASISRRIDKLRIAMDQLSHEVQAAERNTGAST